MPSTTTLWIYDVIGEGLTPEEGITARLVRDSLEGLGQDDEIVVRINSPGGDVFEAVAIRSLLDQHPGKITVKVDGLSASAATMIQMAGDEIELASGSMVMIHEPWGLTIGDAAEHASQATALEKIAVNISEMYAARGEQDAAEFRALMQAETWLTADEAIQSGLADRIIETSAKACKVPSEFGYRNQPQPLEQPTEGAGSSKMSAAAKRRRITLTRLATNA